METFSVLLYSSLCSSFKSYYVVWKPVDFKAVQIRKNSLNRTMQYGNLQILRAPIMYISRLNRTMQYGNMVSSTKCVSTIGQFKSYYVVWKRHEKSANHCDWSLFKSYYVVWKLQFPRRKKKQRQKFKSYYVVWKPICVYSSSSTSSSFKSYYVVWKQTFGLCMFELLNCLNRTMQYGNYTYGFFITYIFLV